MAALALAPSTKPNAKHDTGIALRCSLGCSQVAQFLLVGYVLLPGQPVMRPLSAAGALTQFAQLVLVLLRRQRPSGQVCAHTQPGPTQLRQALR